jgi:hypothetical protein
MLISGDFPDIDNAHQTNPYPKTNAQFQIPFV